MNLCPTDIANEIIDKQLILCGWDIICEQKVSSHEKIGAATRNYIKGSLIYDYVLYIDFKPVGYIKVLPPTTSNDAYTPHNFDEYLRTYQPSELNKAYSYLYLSYGVDTYFMDLRDPTPEWRKITTFHRPETIHRWVKRTISLRTRFARYFPEIDSKGLSIEQVSALSKIENSLQELNKITSLELPTDLEKYQVTITSFYRLIKHTKVLRVLYLVNDAQEATIAESHFANYVPQDDTRFLPDIYSFIRLHNTYIPQDHQAYITSIQRLYCILKNRDLEQAEAADGDDFLENEEVLPIEYNEKVPMEFFDVIVFDTCPDTLDGRWQPIFDYLDAFHIRINC